MVKQFRVSGRSFPSVPINMPAADINDVLAFPELSVESSNLCVKPAEWNLTKTEPKDNSKVYPNGDVFEGDFDAITGRPSYGKIMYANGNVYEGPIHYSWPQDKESNDDDGGGDGHAGEEECEKDWEGDEGSEDFWDDKNAEEEREGIWTFPDGKVFVGVACFGKEW